MFTYCKMGRGGGGGGGRGKRREERRGRKRRAFYLSKQEEEEGRCLGFFFSTHTHTPQIGYREGRKEEEKERAEEEGEKERDLQWFEAEKESEEDSWCHRSKKGRENHLFLQKKEKTKKNRTWKDPLLVYCGFFSHSPTYHAPPSHLSISSFLPSSPAPSLPSLLVPKNWIFLMAAIPTFFSSTPSCLAVSWICAPCSSSSSSSSPTPFWLHMRSFSSLSPSRVCGFKGDGGGGGEEGGRQEGTMQTEWTGAEEKWERGEPPDLTSAKKGKGAPEMKKRISIVSFSFSLHSSFVNC